MKSFLVGLGCIIGTCTCFIVTTYLIIYGARFCFGYEIEFKFADHLTMLVFCACVISWSIGIAILASIDTRNVNPFDKIMHTPPPIKKDINDREIRYFKGVNNQLVVDLACNGSNMLWCESVDGCTVESVMFIDGKKLSGVEALMRLARWFNDRCEYENKK